MEPALDAVLVAMLPLLYEVGVFIVDDPRTVAVCRIVIVLDVHDVEVPLGSNKLEYGVYDMLVVGLWLIVEAFV